MSNIPLHLRLSAFLPDEMRRHEAAGASYVVDLVLILLENACFDQLVDELLHRVEGCQKSLWRKNEACACLRRGCLAFLCGLQCHEVQADHAAREVNLANAVSKDFFFVCHGFAPESFCVKVM